MNPVSDLKEAWQGLALTVAGKPEAAGHFRANLSGLLVALLWFALALILTAAAQSVGVGMPEASQVLVGFVIQGVTLGVLALLTSFSTKFLGIDVPLLKLFVPIVYFMGLMQVLAIPLVLLGPNVQIVAVIVLTLLIWRAGVVLGGMRTGVAIAFALLCLMALVAVPNALYMLFLAVPSPA